MKKSDTFTAKCDWYSIICTLSDEQQLELFRNMFLFAKTGTTQFSNKSVQVAFKFIKKDLQDEKNKREELSEKRKQASSQRWNKRQNR